MPKQPNLKFTPIINTEEELAQCVEDAIYNELGEIGADEGHTFVDIPELYEAYMESEKMIKDQDLHIIQLEMKIEEMEKEIKLLKELVYQKS